MFATQSSYDRGVSTFDPSGRLFQVEYAMEAIKLGSTSIGIQTAEGVVLVAEKRITSSLLVPSSVVKVVEVDTHVGCAMSGLTADARTMLDHARVEAQHHRFTYDEPMSVAAVTQATCDLALRFGEDDDDDTPKMSRPFGVALLFAGVDKRNGPQLIYADPSGTYVRFDAKAIGGAAEGAQSTLVEQYSKSLSLHDAQVLALKTLKEVVEDKITVDNVDIAVVPTASAKFRILSKDEVTALLDEVGNA